MTPPLALIDTQLERQLVAALIDDPTAHDLCGSLAAVDFGDAHAQRAYTTLANVLAAGEWVTLDSLRQELQRDHDLRGPHRTGEETLQPCDLQWLVDLSATSLPAERPIAQWAAQVQVLAETRRGAIASAEPVPRRQPRGPRAANTEPTRLAEAFRAYRYQLHDEPTLVRWARAWWRYDGTRYVEHDDEALDRDLIGFLDVAVAPVTVTDRATGVARAELRRVTSKNKTISEVRKALSHVMPMIAGGAPQWTSPVDGDPKVENVIACRNGILDVRSRRLFPSTPRLFSTTAVACDWNPDAPEPTAWIAFLRSLWGDDAESIQALKQMFGYLLTADTSHQKMFAVIGPPRSGKGTIARVLKALLGDDAVVNPTLQSLERPFGLAPLVGKTVAVIGDARLGGHSDQQQVVERLLSISGEDSLSIDRKNRDPINVRLRVRVVLLSNELPRLYDTSGALASRFLILCLSRSFLGSEDTGLEAKLLAELPGILRWALDGHDDLAEAGRFLSPLASEQAVRHMKAISNPLGVFLEECCEVGVHCQVEIAALYERYEAWCKSNGREPANRQVFGRDLHTMHPEVTVVQQRRPDGVRTRLYEGIRTL